MNPDIQHLIRLQQLDSEIESARRRIAEIPAVQEALAARLEQATAAVAAVKAAARREPEPSGRRSRPKSPPSRPASPSTRDSCSSSRPTRNTRPCSTRLRPPRRRSDRTRTASSSAWKKPRTSPRDLKAAEAELKTQQAAIATERKALDGGSRRRCSAPPNENTAARGDASRSSSPPRRCKLFEHVSKQRKGLAVAEARDGSCSVCHVRMRPQMYNEVRRGENLIQCESCLRILYAPAATTQAS